MYALFIFAASVTQQLKEVTAFGPNATQLTFIKYVYVDPLSANTKSFFSPFITYVDNFMENVYSGDNNLSKFILEPFESSIEEIEHFWVETIVPFTTGKYLKYEIIQDCEDAMLCNRFDSNPETESNICYQFKVTDDDTGFPINYFSSPLYRIFKHFGIEGSFLEAGTMSFTIKFVGGKPTINTTEFVCRGPPDITLDKLSIEDFVHGSISLDLRTLCVNDCIEQVNGEKLQGYKIKYINTVEAVEQVRDIEFYFAWAGTLSGGEKCRSEREAWYYYLRFEPSESFVDAVVDYWGQIDEENK